MKIILIANALTLVGSVILTLSGLIKNKKKFLVVQCVMTCAFAAGNLLLGGYSGTIVNGMNLFRNLINVNGRFTRPQKIIFIAIQTGMTLLIGTDSLIMWLPVIANAVFTWFMDTEDMVRLKLIFGSCQLMWAVYDFSIKNYAGVPFDIAAIVTSSIAIATTLSERKKAGKE